MARSDFKKSDSPYIEALKTTRTLIDNQIKEFESGTDFNISFKADYFVQNLLTLFKPFSSKIEEIAQISNKWYQETRKATLPRKLKMIIDKSSERKTSLNLDLNLSRISKVT